MKRNTTHTFQENHIHFYKMSHLIIKLTLAHTDLFLYEKSLQELACVDKQVCHDLHLSKTPLGMQFVKDLFFWRRSMKNTHQHLKKFREILIIRKGLRTAACYGELNMEYATMNWNFIREVDEQIEIWKSKRLQRFNDPKETCFQHRHINIDYLSCTRANLRDLMINNCPCLHCQTHGVPPSNECDCHKCTTIQPNGRYYWQDLTNIRY